MNFPKLRLAAVSHGCRECINVLLQCHSFSNFVVVLMVPLVPILYTVIMHSHVSCTEEVTVLELTGYCYGVLSYEASHAAVTVY
jgi:hypothetical protein